MTLRHKLQEMFPELSDEQRELLFKMLGQVRRETRLPGSTAAAARFASLRFFGGLHALVDARPDEPLLSAEEIGELDDPNRDCTLTQLLTRIPSPPTNEQDIYKKKGYEDKLIIESQDSKPMRRKRPYGY